MGHQLTESEIKSLTSIFGEPKITDHPGHGLVSASVEGFISVGDNNSILSRGGANQDEAIGKLWDEVASYIRMGAQSPSVCVYLTEDKGQPKRVITNNEGDFDTVDVSGYEAQTVFGLNLPAHK